MTICSLTLKEFSGKGTKRNCIIPTNTDQTPLGLSSSILKIVISRNLDVEVAVANHTLMRIYALCIYYSMVSIIDKKINYSRLLGVEATILQ